MRRLSILVVGVVLAAGTLAACVGAPTKPPPPPPPPPPVFPHDVLVVGDSQAHAFGCSLGDDLNGLGGPCPTVPGFSTINQTIGACTIWGNVVALYNGGTAGVPNCGPAPGGFENLTWAQMADKYVPSVVVINSSGWEIVDKWINFVGPPDARWTASGSADDFYRAAIVNAINEFRARGAQVLLANAPYADPPQPVPPVSEVGPELGCSWWEPDDAAAPISAGPDCDTGETWNSGHGVSYLSSHTKLDRLNAVMTSVKATDFASDGGVRLFNTARHFNFSNLYASYVCPPPHDGTVQPPSLTTGGTCPAPSNQPAILARAADNSHMSSAGMFQVLKPYLVDCVEGMLGLAGGDLNDCN